MLSLDEVASVLASEFQGIPESTRLEQFMVARWGSTDEVYDLLGVIVKSGAQFSMDEFDKLPQSLRERLAKSPFPLDERTVLEYYTNFGVDSTFTLIANMEKIAEKVIKDAA